ncbi:MAG: arylsulfatase [Armatimonadetes bacterium]|nr:arylsulfatase [Armatimonadota bacterium]
MSKRPNIVLILADDMGYGDLGAFGNPDVRTPHLDRLASEGVTLTQHYSASAVCAPARAGLLTGRYPHRTGAIDTLEGRGLDRLALREVTLADMLKADGYATGLFGKWHLGALDPAYHPHRRGFDEFAGFRGGWQDYWEWNLDVNGSARKADGRYLTDVFTDEAVGFIERHHHEPFFLHVAYNAPHTPLQVPDDEADPFRETGKYHEAVSILYGMNRRMDKGIGRILETLERYGIAEDTIVLFTSDNGPQFGSELGPGSLKRYNGHLNRQKGSVYEGGIRVPAILRWPGGMTGGRQVHDLVHFTDWLPTLLSAAEVDGGADGPRDLPLDGEDALPLLRGERGAANPVRLWQWNRYTPVASCNAAMREGPWKLIRPSIPEAMTVSPEDLAMDRRLKYEPDTVKDMERGPEPGRTLPDPPPPLLFHLEEDPYELHDRAESQPDRVRRMQAELDRWFDSVERDRRAS